MVMLSSEDKAKIEQAIAAIEKDSAGEIVVATVAESAAYGFWRVAFAWVVAAAASLGALWFVPEIAALQFFVLQCGVLMAGLWALRVPALFRFVTPERFLASAARDRAFRMFAERGIFRTKDRTGVLLMVSVLEHQVVLLGDEGIHQRVGTEGWERHVEVIVAGIQQGRPADAIIEVLAVLGGALKEKLPVTPQDENELPARVVEE